jgi:Xaa-Pro aminopeptidase
MRRVGMKIFSEQEMQRRLDIVTSGLKDRGIDVAFLHTADNAYYVTGVPLLSGWGRPMWAVVWSDGRVAVVGSMIERESMDRYAWANEVLAYDDEENVWDASLRMVSELITAGGSMPGRIGVERPYLAVDTRDALAARVPAEQIDITDVLMAARLVKGDEEIALLRLAGEVGKIGANAFLEALHTGVTELAVASYAVEEMNRALGAVHPEAATSSYAYCHLGENSLSPHLHPTSRRLRRGDVVALNVFPVIWGYCMELERTYVYGDQTREQASALKAATDAFSFAKDLYRPGMSIKDLHSQATNVLVEAGYGNYLRHGTGHAHGIMIGQANREEGGELRSYNPGAIRPRMVNSIEPGIYIPGLGGFRHSDVMLATTTGAELLTEFPVEMAL